MEVPKHTKQVGTISANKKLYLEDYCISYIKQLNNENPGERKQIALYGLVEKDKGIEYAYAYGAALLGKGNSRTDSLTNAQKEEAEQARLEYFKQYQLMGVVITSDAVHENVYWLGNGNKSILLEGYYIFYDRNEAMLTFMMRDQQEDRAIDIDPVIAKKADMDREKQEKARQQALAEAERKNGRFRKELQKNQAAKKRTKKPASAFPAAACLLVLAIGGVWGFKTYYPEYSLDTLKNSAGAVWENVVNSAGSYLGGNEDQEVLSEGVENETSTDSEEEEDTVLVSGVVEPPAEMDTIIIPDPDTIQEGSGDAESPAQESTAAGSTEQAAGAETTQGNETREPEKTGQPEQEDTQPREYHIQAGDSLLRILRNYYGDESRLQEVCDINQIADPDNIQVGQTILLP